MQRDFKTGEDPEGKWRAGYICTFCQALHRTKEEATKCWESHSSLTWEPVWGGIGSGSDIPVECIIKKHERGMITEVAVYKLESRKKVRIKEG